MIACVPSLYRLKMYLSIGVLTGSFLTRKKEINTCCIRIQLHSWA